jgi:hypothetical protein
MAGERSALLIGAGRFTDAALQRLPATEADIETLGGLLADSDIGDYDVEVRFDPSVQDTRVAIEDFFSDARPDDVKVLYYAGHGLKNESGDLYFAATDTMLGRLASTAIGADFVNRAMNACRARRIVLILDCCYSGAFGRGMIARSGPGINLLDQFDGRGRAVLASSNAMEYAFEGTEGPVGPDDPAPGALFTTALIRGLGTGAADLNGDGLIDVDELYEYIFDEVRRVSTNQTPQKFVSDASGLLIFAKAVNSPVVAEAEVAESGASATVVGPATVVETPAPTVETAVDWAADAPARQDYLNRKCLADVLASRLREVRREDPTTSFLLHLDGAWGTGKSSLLNFLDERLADEFTVVRFDAWRQSRITPPWWALLSATRRGITEGRGLFSSGWLRIGETYARTRRSGATYLLAVILLLIGVGVTAMLVLPGGEPLANLAGKATTLVAAVATLWAGALVASRLLLWDSARGARLFEQSTANPMDDVAAHFGWLLDHSAKPVLFFVDDLDRCPAPYVVELLDAIQTLVRDAPGAKAAYFVVAADGAWLRTSYESAYRSFETCVSTLGLPLGYLFLDKLFQLTVPVPVATPRARSAYLDRLLHVADEQTDERTRQEVRTAQEVIARDGGDEARILRIVREASPAAREVLVADAARALAAPQTRARTEHALRKFLPLLHSNPRNVKKFLNTYSMLRSVRVLENNTVSSDVLALWTIIRVRWPAMADHLEAHPEAVRGIVEPLWADECLPPHLRELAAEPDLRDVVRCRDGGPLTAQVIRLCIGTAEADGTA